MYLYNSKEKKENELKEKFKSIEIKNQGLAIKLKELLETNTSILNQNGKLKYDIDFELQNKMQISKSIESNITKLIKEITDNFPEVDFIGLTIAYILDFKIAILNLF